MARFFCVTSSIVLLFLHGCDVERDSTFIQPQLSLLLAPALAQQRPTAVEIWVTDSGNTASHIPRTVILDSPFAFDVLPGVVRIKLRVFFDDDSAIEDEKIVEVTQSTAERQIFFTIDPPGEPVLGIDSDAFFPIAPGERFSIQLYIRNVDALYAAAIRLRFDDNISPTQVEHNASFWGTDAIMISGDTVSRSAGKDELDIAWTRLRDDGHAPGTDKKEGLATVHFLAETIGASTISFVMDGLNVYRMDGTPLFSIDSQFSEDLDLGTIPVELRQAFDDNGIPLSEDAVVSRRDAHSWLIAGENDGQYIVSLETVFTLTQNRAGDAVDSFEDLRAGLREFRFNIR